MFSLCRLCATCIEPTQRTTEVSELESKLAICCGWKPLENEVQLPKKVCHQCVDQLQRSWNFVEQIWVAEKQLTKLLSEEIPISSQENLSNNVKVKIEKESKDVDNVLDLEKSTDVVYDEDVFGESINYFDDDSSNENVKVDKNSDKKQTTSDPFLAVLSPEDCLPNGMISANGLAKLEKLYPDMKTMSWNDCEYKCDRCDRIIKGPHDLYAHIRSIHTDELFSINVSCVYCDAQHRREFTLNRHIATEHYMHLKFR